VEDGFHRVLVQVLSSWSSIQATICMNPEIPLGDGRVLILGDS
jgi:hypothetical protein